MRNTLVIGIYMPFSVVTAGIFFIELFRRHKRKEDYFFTLLCFYALGWYVVCIWGLLTRDAAVVLYCYHLSLIFVSLIPPTLLRFIVRFYKYEVPGLLRRFAPWLLFVVPAITSALALASPAHRLLTSRMDIVSLWPFRETVVVWGPWFWVHTAYSYVLSMIIVGLIVWQHRLVARFYRTPSTLMVLGVSITLLGNLVTLLKIIPPVIEPTLITMSLSIIFFSLAILNNNSSKFVRFSRAHIYHYLAEYILVLDEKNQIIDYNKAAATWFSEQGIALHASSLEAVTEELMRRGEVMAHDNGGEEAGQDVEGVDIRIQSQPLSVVLNQRIYRMKDARDDSIGKIVVYSDVTQNRMLIERLETKAGVDSLTGISNHMAYVGAKGRLDSNVFLPLSVVVCDANKLKVVNDTMGHTYGDLMLQTMATTLEEACPQGGFVARTGGDEFVYLLPRTGFGEAETLIAQLRRRFQEIEGLPFPLSMAFGAATKESAEQSIDEVIALADERMYTDKRGGRK